MRSRLPANAPGRLFVDSSCSNGATVQLGTSCYSCIRTPYCCLLQNGPRPPPPPCLAVNCDTCRWMAPDTYGHAGGKSFVHTQPPSATGALKAAALAAMVACPTGSIRLAKGEREADVKVVKSSFPLQIDDERLPNVFHAGSHSPASFGAMPYLLLSQTSALVDSPRYNSQLADRIATLCGGAPDFLLLTHMDDVSDHQRWAKRFPTMTRVIHSLDVRDERSWPYIDMTSVEKQLTGGGPWELAPGLEAIHTPGHSRGHLCFLASGSLTGGDGALFTGDHLAFSGRLGRLDGFARYGWDHAKQVGSIRKLAQLPFRFVLPGHGRRYAFRTDAEREEAIAACADEFERDPMGSSAPGPVYVEPGRPAPHRLQAWRDQL